MRCENEMLTLCLES